MFSRVFVTTMAIVGGLGASQAPELSQQYTQRVGGAADELASVVERFDSDASQSGLDRNKALDEYNSGSQFVQTQGGRMRETVERYEYLSRLYAELKAAGPFARTWIIVRHSDRQIMRRTVDDYKPAVPTTTDGAAHAGAGAGIFGVLGAFIAYLFGGMKSRRNRYA